MLNIFHWVVKGVQNCQEGTNKMKCKKVRKKLLLFLDGDLSEKQRIKIQHHLKGCPGCLKQVDVVSKLWNDAGELERIESSPYLWNRLSLRIAKYESSKNLFSAFFETIARYAVPATAVVILLIGIFSGIYLGSFPNSQQLDASRLNSDITAKERFVRSSYLDSFDDLPPESICGIYNVLTSE